MWVLDDPEYLKPLEEDLAPVSRDQAAARVRTVVSQAIGDLEEVVIPYLRERIEWESPEVRRARALEWERFGRLKERFDVQFYRWALAECRRELAAGCPRIRLVADDAGLAQGFLSYLASSSRSDRDRLATALVRRAHRTGAQLAGEAMTPDEAALVEAYTGTVQQSLKSPDVETYRVRRVPMDRDAILNQVRTALRPILGEGGEPTPSRAASRAREWLWETAVSGWTVRTSVAVEGWLCKITYRHALEAIDSPYRWLVRDVALLSWLGTSRETTWAVPTPADVAPAVAAVASLCADFVRAVPELTAGLAPDWARGEDLPE